jgi:hypothetical protein
VKDLASRLVIGPTNNLVGLAILDYSVHRRLQIGSHQKLHDFMHDLIYRLRFHQAVSNVTVSDVSDFLTMELSHLDRRESYKNSVLIIADHTALPDPDAHHHLPLHIGGHTYMQLSSVTVINVGGANPTGLSQLATDSNHVIDVHDYASLRNSLSQVLQLLCS